MAKQNAIRRQLFRACVITWPKINAIVIYLYKNTLTPTTCKYMSSQARHYWAWSFPCNHLDIQHSSLLQYWPLTPNPETPPIALHNSLFACQSEMQHNTDKEMKATQQQSKQHHDTQVREQTLLHAGQLFYVDCPLLSTPAADKLEVEAY